MKARYIIGSIFIFLGISALTGIDLGRFIIPVFLIAIGWMILRGKKQSEERVHTSATPMTTQDGLNEIFIFSGTEKRLSSHSFSGGKIVTVFGGADIDLSEVTTKQKIIALELVAVFGGIRLRIPKNWIVVSEAVGILGGIENRSHAEQKTTELRITGAAVLGGIEISN